MSNAFGTNRKTSNDGVLHPINCHCFCATVSGIVVGVEGLCFGTVGYVVSQMAMLSNWALSSREPRPTWVVVCEGGEADKAADAIATSSKSSDTMLPLRRSVTVWLLLSARMAVVAVSNAVTTPFTTS